MPFNTPDLCDQFPERIGVAAPLFRHFGAKRKFAEQIVTIKCHEGLRSALVGDGVAEWAREHGWAGMVIYGCVRDIVALAKVDIGVLAIGVNPPCS